MKQDKDTGELMTELAVRAGSDIKEMAAILATFPEPGKWTQEQKTQAVQFAALLDTAQKMISAKNIAGIDWKKEQETFLSDTRSDHTRRAYAAALGRLDVWASREGVNPLELSPGQADTFIRELKADGRASASARRDIAAVSAFFTWLERYHSAIKNPIRGTKIRPPKENKKETVIPTAADYKAILAELPPIDKAIVIVMASRGLRAGALPALELKKGKYHGKSKGKVLEENGTPGITLSRPALTAIKAAGLDEKKPFAWDTRQGTKNSAAAIEGRINYHIDKLYQQGKISARFSCHDFRHFFAVNEYKKNKDIFRLSKLLNHAGIQITQTYLKSLGVEI